MNIRPFAFFSKISGINPFKDFDAWFRNYKRNPVIRIIITAVLLFSIILAFTAKLEILKVISILLFLLWLLTIVRKFTNWLIITALLLFILLAINELSKNTVTIKELAIAPQFTEKYNGYTGEVLSSHIYDEINSIVHQLATFDPANFSLSNQNPKDRFIYDINSSAAPEIYYQQIGISINALFQNVKKSGYFKNIFHYKFYIIDGDMTKESKSGKWYLTIRLTEDNLRISEKFEWKEDSTPKEIAEFILKFVDMANLARYYQYYREYDKLIAACQDNISWKGHSAEIHNSLGIAYASKNQVNRAIQEFIIAKEIDPTYMKSYFNLGIAELSIGNIPEAVKSLKLALKYQPDDADINRMLGSIYYNNRDIKNAIYYYKKTVRISPNNPIFLMLLGNSYAAAGQADRAIQILNKAIKLNPYQAEIYLSIAQVYEKKNRKFEASQAWNNFIFLCTQYIDKNQPERAIMNLLEALNLKPETPEFYLTLSQAYQKKGDKVNAVKALKYFIRYWKGDQNVLDEANRRLKELSLP